MTQTRSPRSGEAPVSTSSSPWTSSTASERGRMKIPTATSFASDHRFGARAADQFLERGLVADRIEVRVVLCERAKPLRHVDRAPEVVDRVGRPAGEALAAGEDVEQASVLRLSLAQSASAISRLVVLSRPVEDIQ